MYTTLARYYEELFPASDRSIEFLAGIVSGGASSLKVLDAACGTGEHARKLAALGFEVTGIDLDPAMISEARRRRVSGTEFLVGDMTDLSAVLDPDARFDLAVCLGNSLVHLPDTGAITRFFDAVADHLTVEGSVVTQIINFESITRGVVPELPPLVSVDGRVRFERSYRLDSRAGHVSFVTHLSVDGVAEAEDSIDLLPVTSEDLSRMLHDAGFDTIRRYGGFDGSAWGDDSFVTIVVAGRSSAKKKGGTEVPPG